MIFGFFSAYAAVSIIHVLGVIIGGGAAIMSDLIFFSSLKDGTISPTEMRFLKLGSAVVWAGIFVIILSGTFLFLLDPSGHLASGKFLAKMTIVAIIILNGVVFHFAHLPLLARTVGQPLGTSPEFRKRSMFLLASGAISSVSWLSAFVLGSLRSLPFTYGQIVSFYFLVLGFSILTGLLLRKRLFPIA